MIAPADAPNITLSLTPETAWALMWVLSPIPGPVAEQVYTELKTSLRELARA